MATTTTTTTTTTTDTTGDDVETKAQKLYRGVALAPMVRASTTPLRVLALKYGADVVYTEELVDRSLSATIREVSPEGYIDFLRDTSGLSKKVKKRVAKDGGRAIMLRIDPSIERGKLICQLGTGEPNFALAAALHVHKDVDAIDINMGCPKKFSVSGGMGSALLTDPGRAASIIRTLRQEITDKPISCKIRIIKDTQTTVDFCTAMINAGALAIGIHARRVGDESTQPADWKTLREVVPLLKSKFPSIPVIVNGDFYTRQEWMDVMEDTGANGVMLARPALYNTSIFRKPTASMTGPFGYTSPLLLGKTRVVQDYAREAARYNIHYKNAKYVICEMMTNRRTPAQRCHHLEQKFPDGQTIASVCNCQSIDDICKLWKVDPKEAEPTNDKVEALADEHRYEDSYFLKDMTKDETGGVEERDIKRAKIEDEQPSLV